MAPLTFEKPLCGPSLDMFSKDYAHENVCEVEHTDAEKRVNFSNNFKLARGGSLFGHTHLKGDCGVVHAEVKLQNAGSSHVEVSALNPFYKPLAFHSKYAFEAGKQTNTLTLAAEHTLPFNTSQFKLLPLSAKYSAFSLFTYKATCWQLSGGAEISGSKDSLLSSHVLGVGYKNTHMGKTYMVSARLLGEQEGFVKSIVGNAYAATAKGNVSNALSVAVEHKLEDATTKLKFAGQWHIAHGDSQNPAYVKAKCDSDGQVAVTLFQRFNEKLAAAFGVDFSAKSDATAGNVNYGFKLLLS